MEKKIQKALLGWCLGDGFGSQTEGMEPERVEALGELAEVYSFEEEVPHCGISSYVSDLPILFALSFLELERVDYDHLRSTYRRYIKEEPDFLEPSLEDALSNPMEKGERVFHLGRSVTGSILSALLSGPDSKMIVKKEVALTSANETVQEAADLYSQALAALILREADTVDELFLLLLRSRTLGDEMKSLVQGARNSEAIINPTTVNSPHIRPTLLSILSALQHAATFKDGMIALAQGGGSSRLHCALYGGLAGMLFDPLPESWIAELHVSSVLDAMIKKQTLYRRETLTFEKIIDSLSKKLCEYEE